MGADIHLRVERRNPQTQKWEAWPGMPPQYGELGHSFTDGPEARDYCVFAALADVRNGIGFAGMYTHPRVESWFPNRGLPPDADRSGLDAASCTGFEDTGPGPYPERQPGEPDDRFFARCREHEDEHEKYKWMGEHSFTHATVAELLACPWDMEFGDGWRPLLDSAFYRWLTGAEMSAAVAELGAENIRVLMGFDS